MCVTSRSCGESSLIPSSSSHPQDGLEEMGHSLGYCHSLGECMPEIHNHARPYQEYIIIIYIGGKGRRSRCLVDQDSWPHSKSVALSLKCKIFLVVLLWLLRWRAKQKLCPFLWRCTIATSNGHLVALNMRFSEHCHCRFFLVLPCLGSPCQLAIIQQSLTTFVRLLLLLTSLGSHPHIVKRGQGSVVEHLTFSFACSSTVCKSKAYSSWQHYVCT